MHFLKRVDFEGVDPMSEGFFARSDFIYQFLCYSLCVVFGILLLPVYNTCPGIMCTLIFFALLGKNYNPIRDKTKI